jgi:hypothetical protein
MKRPAGIVITAVLQVLGSFLVLLVAGAMMFLPRFAPRNHVQPPMPSGLFVLTGAIYLFFAVVGLATAIGIFQWKQWARYSTVTFAVILVGLGLLMAAVFAFMPFPTHPQPTSAAVSPNFALTFKVVTVLIQLAVAALGAWWLYYFNQTKVTLLFKGQSSDDTKASGRRPLSITVLSVLTLVGLPWMLVGAWMALPIAFFGILLRGTNARLVYLVFAAAAIHIGVGLWRLAPASRLAAVAFYVFGCVNATLFYALPGREDRYHQILAETSQIWHLPNTTPQPQPSVNGVWLGMLVCWVTAAFAIYFLIARRSVFTLPSEHL